MKKMSLFGLLAVLVLSFASVAQAADIKATGKWQIEAQWNNALDYTKYSQEENYFHIEQRMRTAFQFIANENLKAVLDTQIGSSNWGNGLYAVGSGRSPNTAAGNTASSVGAGQGNIMLRQGYIDFKWPNTPMNFKVGFQTVSLPAAFGGGSAILDDQVAAAVVSSPITDNVKILAGYTRASDSNQYGTTATTNGNGTYADAVFAAVPVDFQGFNITPFGTYLYAGKTTGLSTSAGLTSSGAQTEGTRAYWGGVAFTMTALDPFKVMADFNYGKATYSNKYNSDPTNGGRQGWLFDLAVDYTGLSMMTPEAFFAYTSGEGGANTDKSGRMPTIGKPQNWSIGSFFFGDRNFINGFATNNTSSSVNGYESQVAGFWTLGASLKDIKYFDNFSHTFTVMYIQGTNDADYLKGSRKPGATYGAMLTDKDHLWEVDFNTKYKIYDELSMYLDLGYINASIDKDSWKNVSAAYGTSTYENPNAYKIGLGMAYAF
ncbi:outer membrane homotrimeric porin [Humidesulfovibrio idahonensis]